MRAKAFTLLQQATWGRTVVALVLSCACSGETPASPLQAAGGTAGAEPGGPVAGTAGAGGTATPSPPTGLSWAAADSAAPDVDLSIAFGLGQGAPQVNAAGDILIVGRGPVVVDGEKLWVPTFRRVDRSGNVAWSRAYAAREAFLFAALQAAGGTLVAGGLTGVLNLGDVQLESWRNPSSAAGSASNRDETYKRGEWSRDLVVFRLDASGAVSWAQRYGDAGDQSAQAVALSPAGELVAVGQFVGQLKVGEHALVSRGGSTRPDLFIAHFDAAGNALSLWREDPLNVQAITVDAQGAVWIAGRLEAGEINGRLLKLDLDGQRQWAVPIVGWPTSLAVDAAGSAYLVLDPTNPGSQLFGRTLTGAQGALVKVSASGELEWLRELDADFVSSSAAVDARGNVGIAGTYRSGIDLGGGLLESSGDTDLYFASFSPDAALRYSLRLGGHGFDGAGLVAATPRGWLMPLHIESPIDAVGTQINSGEHLLWIDEQ